jgi:hypothetical protein
MKKIVLIFLFVSVTTIGAFAQKKSNNNATASLDKPQGSGNYVKKRKTVDATQKAYFKKVGKKTAKNKDCDCPGNPKNKKNRQNPYKRKRGY